MKIICTTTGDSCGMTRDLKEAQAEIDELVHKLRYLERNKSRIRDEDWLSVIELIAKHKGE